MAGILAAVLVALILALISLRGYGHRRFEQTAGPLISPDDYLVQADDFGQFWEAGDVDVMLDGIRASAQRGNTIVVLYVHGWNHNGAPTSRDLRSFAKSMNDTRDRLTGAGSGPYAQSRYHLTGDESVRIIGVYVGWRGRSLPGPFNYLTFWGRKAAAERVGEGGLRELVARLDAVYRLHRESRERGETRHFLGWASFGHSFGGQALFRAVSGTLESTLADFVARADREGIARGAAAPVRDLRGVGDLIVLINPAFEAMQYERIDRLRRALAFDRAQLPLLLVISSAGDVPRQLLFPLGRHLHRCFRVRTRDREQMKAWTQTLGEYLPQRTHDIALKGRNLMLIPGFDPSTYSTNPGEILDRDLTDVAEVSGVCLQPRDAHHPNNPFLVAYTDWRVVRNHSDQFAEVLARFLNDYVALVQGKRMLSGTGAPGAEATSQATTSGSRIP